ncbi:MAG: cation acetate symporter, partial [Gammaproteobacteria bacterium]|nr:cation acetate symporter [Gammaproteobacteria bacterium]
AAVAIGLSVLFRNINVGVLSTIALAVAASVNFPAICLALFWNGLTTRGAVTGGVTGLVVVAVLIILGPTVWVDVLGNETAIFPYAYPTLFSVAAAFAVTIVVSLTDRSDRAVLDREAFAEQVVRAETGGERPKQERYSG